MNTKATRKEQKVAQMTNPVLQTLGCFFSSPASFFFFSLLIFFFFFPILFLFCSFYVSDTTTCFHSATRNYPEKLTCQPTASPSVLCEHLFTEGHWCKTVHGLFCWGLPASPLPLQEMGLLPSTRPQHPFFFWCSALENCSVAKWPVGNPWSGIFAPGNTLPHWRIWTAVAVMV